MGVKFARLLATGALLGAVSGGITGFLGRLAMRLLAVTSPNSAQRRLTDDLARVGEITPQGTLFLVLFTAVLGSVGGLVYLLVRRVLPEGVYARMASFGVLTAAVGGAVLVHDHPSFDYTVLQPTWLAVTLFICVPTGFGAVTALLVETLDRPGGLLRRVPSAIVIAIGAAVLIPTIALTAVPIAVAFLVALNARLRALWASRAVTVIGYVAYAVLVLWGVYGLAADIVSLATDRPSEAPLNI